MIDLTYWFMFPVGIVIATIAMMSGIGGAVLFSPLFLLVLKLRPDVALGTSIFIELFGFSSGFIGYARKRLINFHLGKKILLYAVPATLVGVFIGKFVSGFILQAVFAAGIFAIGASLTSREHNVHTHHITATHHTQPHRKHKPFNTLPLFSGIGGLFVGLISSGLGEINEYSLLNKMKLKPAVAAGTSVFAVIVTALVASVSHITYFLSTVDYPVLFKVLSIVIFAVPGVIIGGQLGVVLVQKVTVDGMKHFLSFLFMILGMITLLALFA